MKMMIKTLRLGVEKINTQMEMHVLQYLNLGQTTIQVYITNY